jgi:Domain of unknown function (DUF4203)
MNDFAWTGNLTAPLAIAVGLVACFWGYRLVKLMIGIMGFVAGAAGAWVLLSSLAPSHGGLVLIGAAIAGVLGAVICLWLFYLGVFLLGAGAGAVIAAAALGGTGYQASPVLLLIVAVVFGLLALVLQKLMIVLSTAFSGSYLLTAALLHYVNAGHSNAPLWFDRSPSAPAGVLGYAALAFWLIVGLVGASFQYGGRRPGKETARRETEAAST